MEEHEGDVLFAFTLRWGLGSEQFVECAREHLQSAWALTLCAVAMHITTQTTTLKPGACALAREDVENVVEGEGHVLQGQNEGGSIKTFCVSALAKVSCCEHKPT